MKKSSARIDHFGIRCKDHFLELSTLLRVDWFGRESHYNSILYRTKDTTKLNASENTQPRKTREQKTQCKIIRERKHDREENAKTNYQKKQNNAKRITEVNTQFAKKKSTKTQIKTKFKLIKTNNGTRK